MEKKVHLCPLHVRKHVNGQKCTHCGKKGCFKNQWDLRDLPIAGKVSLCDLYRFSITYLDFMFEIWALWFLVQLVGLCRSHGTFLSSYRIFKSHGTFLTLADSFTTHRVGLFLIYHTTKLCSQLHMSMLGDPQHMSVCARRVNLLVCSLPLHRHSYIGFILAFTSSIHNKQHMWISSLLEPPHLM
jgi:hypothetical protein